VRRLHITPSIAISLAALMVAVSGGAYAVGASSSKTITACVRHRGGALYIARNCARHDHKLSWNVFGSQGAVGPHGATGAKGTAGPKGLKGSSGFSTATEAYRVTAGNFAGKTSATIVTLANLSGGLAGGSGVAYYITAKTSLEFVSPPKPPSASSCTLTAGTDSDQSTTTIPEVSAAFSGPEVSTELTHTVGAGTTQNVTLSCISNTASEWFAHETKLVAVQVGSETHAAVTG
jgi:hypothetical protein